MRGPFAPRAVPLSGSRSARFDAEVVRAVERLQRGFPELSEVDVAVEEVPPWPRRDGAPDPVSLGRVTASTNDEPSRITVHRRPIELRTGPGEQRYDLIADVVAELVAELLELSPEEVDQDYDRGGAA